MTRTDVLLETERLMKNSGIFFENKLGRISDEIAVSYLYDDFESYAEDYKKLMEKKIEPIDYLVMIKQKIKQHQLINSLNTLEQKLFKR